jgi:hypothetical protein
MGMSGAFDVFDGILSEMFIVFLGVVSPVYRDSVALSFKICH